MYRMAWTDKRMDDFAKRIDQRCEEINGSIECLNETIHRTMLQLGGGLIVTVAIGFVGVVVTQL